jgi:hypothetical protein
MAGATASAMLFFGLGLQLQEGNVAIGVLASAVSSYSEAGQFGAVSSPTTRFLVDLLGDIQRITNSLIQPLYCQRAGCITARRLLCLLPYGYIILLPNG